MKLAAYALHGGQKLSSCRVVRGARAPAQRSGAEHGATLEGNPERRRVVAAARTGGVVKRTGAASACLGLLSPVIQVDRPGSCAMTSTRRN